MVRLRPPGLGVKGGPQQRIPIATGPPPGYAASAGARSELAMDCPRGLPTFFQYGAGTSGAAAAPRVPAPGAAAARPGCRGAAPEVPRRRPRCRGGTPGAAAAPRVPGGGSSGAGRRQLGRPSATLGAAAAPQTCAAARARVPECRRARLPAVMAMAASGKRNLTQMVQQATSDASVWLDVHAEAVQPAGPSRRRPSWPCPTGVAAAPASSAACSIPWMLVGASCPGRRARRAHRALLCQPSALCASPALMSSSLDEPTRRLLPRYARGTLEM